MLLDVTDRPIGAQSSRPNDETRPTTLDSRVPTMAPVTASITTADIWTPSFAKISQSGAENNESNANAPSANLTNQSKQQDHLACDHCSATFEGRIQLYAHIHQVHPQVQAPPIFPCPSCGMSFLKPDQVNEHLEKRHRRPIPARR